MASALAEPLASAEAVLFNVVDASFCAAAGVAINAALVKSTTANALRMELFMAISSAAHRKDAHNRVHEKTTAQTGIFSRPHQETCSCLMTGETNWRARLRNYGASAAAIHGSNQAAALVTRRCRAAARPRASTMAAVSIGPMARTAMPTA